MRDLVEFQIITNNLRTPTLSFFKWHQTIMCGYHFSLFFLLFVCGFLFLDRVSLASAILELTV